MMMKKSRPQDESVQLYHLLNKLALYEPNERDLGLLISYTIVDSLLKFGSNSGDAEERKFQQIKLIYNGLENAIDECAAQDSYPYLCGLKNSVQQSFDNYYANNLQNNPDSSEGLILEIFADLSKSPKNIPDKLKRKGVDLYHLIINEGAKHRKNDYLNADYNSIEKTFT